MSELPGFVDVLKEIGPSGLLFGLLYLFMRLDEKKWTAQRTDDHEKWRALVEQEKQMVAQVLAQHKEERERDFKHLQEQMEYLHGQQATLAMISTALANLQSGMLELKKGTDQLPVNLRDIHARLDILIAEKEKK